MVWVRIDDAISEHPKIASIDDTAFALFVAGLAYCNRNLTDGHIPSAVGYGQLRWADGNTVPAIQQLEKVGLWEQSDKGGWQVHDYLDYQPSRAQVEDERRKKQAAGQAGGLASAQARAQAPATAPAQAESKPVPGPVPVPEPTPKPKDQTLSTPAASVRVSFDQFWAAYPRKEGKRRAESAFKSALRREKADVILAGAQRLAADPNLPEKQFIPHPTTWLNRDGWLDEPLPARSNGQPVRLADRLALSAFQGGDDAGRRGQDPSGPSPLGLPRP